jgi:hypothetical protein
VVRSELQGLLQAARLPELVRFGSFEMRFAPAQELEEMQVGYTIDGVSGEPLTGEGPAHWRASWCVFGQSFLADPIFVDLAVPEVRVFTAQHGVGEWHAIEVAPDLASFAELVAGLQQLCAGRGSPVALQRNPIPDADLAAFRALVQSKGGDPVWWSACLEPEDYAP